MKGIKEKIKRRRNHHLRVPVFTEEKNCIEQKGTAAGISIARYLREVGKGYRITGVMDYERFAN